MTDSVKSWIDERRRIQGAARPFTDEDPDDFENLDPWGPSEDLERISRNGKAGQDAYRNFPRALDALDKVLELHGPRLVSFYSSARMLGAEWECSACGREWPCATAQAIEGAINE